MEQIHTLLKMVERLTVVNNFPDDNQEDLVIIDSLYESIEDSSHFDSNNTNWSVNISNWFKGITEARGLLFKRLC
jgi:hypothetical protein